MFNCIVSCLRVLTAPSTHYHRPTSPRAAVNAAANAAANAAPNNNDNANDSPDVTSAPYQSQTTYYRALVKMLQHSLTQGAFSRCTPDTCCTTINTTITFTSTNTISSAAKINNRF